MSFPDLITAKDAACKHKDETAAALVEAQAILAEAEAADAKAAEAKASAHKAIRDLLSDQGERCTVDDTGTVTIYRSVEPESESDPGWRSYHPITEATLKGTAK